MQNIPSELIITVKNYIYITSFKMKGSPDLGQADNVSYFRNPGHRILWKWDGIVLLLLTTNSFNQSAQKGGTVVAVLKMAKITFWGQKFPTKGGSCNPTPPPPLFSNLHMLGKYVDFREPIIIYWILEYCDIFPQTAFLLLILYSITDKGSVTLINDRQIFEFHLLHFL